MAQPRTSTKTTSTPAQEDTVQDVRTELDKAAVEPETQVEAAPSAAALAAASNLSDADVSAIAARVVSEIGLAEVVDATVDADPGITQAHTEDVTLTREAGGHKEGDTITVTHGAAEYLREQGYVYDGSDAE